MGRRIAGNTAFDRALCELGDVELTIERQRHLVEQLRLAGCSTQYAEALLGRFEVIRTRHARMLAELSAPRSS
ncbi:hypothetical protein [Chelatococcus asaccharovorans]|uniref:Uncharacterized protein n=1 Tax=Chelatococcus asaccharovorans TaxID=28210 RepID=A0A2V3UDT5_9HYPH|nr:hypothetical protein [Chelatococcus asaccharovorans]MBS7706919.1 hypothetical protein [Chelatococcus asaccharovorans]PXW63098.1 hypothetical protein C7450_10213 [Chelatococcus asaccharovorans]CAH1654021.1 conserved hypothetical protein [Chelatococcus asaccharovorans]CAH1694457.1 conserved hypothetical protein [Chelatococcus asaccharovorans]